MKALTPLIAAFTILSSSGCVAIHAAPRLFGGTRTYASVFAGRDFLATRRPQAPYSHAAYCRTSGTMGLDGLLIPMALFDFVPSLAVDLLLLPVSIPYTIHRHVKADPEDPQTATTLQANEARAIEALEDIALAQRTFKLNDAEGDWTADYARDFAELQRVRAGLGEPTPGYVYRLQRSESAPSLQWIATASPRQPGSSGRRYFAVDSTGRVHESEAPFELVGDCVRRGGRALERD